MQKMFRRNGHVPWPVHPNSVVTNTKNIQVGVDCAPGYEHGCYIQGIGTIEIGDYTQVGPNVGIISANHNIYDSRLHNESSVKIGKYCWLGFGSLILPGVTLGDFVIVAGNATVTKSFESGYVVVAGNPAKVVKRLDPSACNRYENEHKYIGFSRVR